jgi:hypothetical protein
MSTNLEPRVPQIGDPVVWHDSTGVPHNALVTAVWGPTCINVVVVSSDKNKGDDYGRQIERNTSSLHKSVNQVHGFYWRFPDEEPNPYVPPIAR